MDHKASGFWEQAVYEMSMQGLCSFKNVRLVSTNPNTVLSLRKLRATQISGRGTAGLDVDNTQSVSTKGFMRLGSNTYFVFCQHLLL